jgi:hypothetical protein
MREAYYRRLLALFAVIIFLANILLAFRPPERIVVRPYLEDSFYLFNAAHHLANGFGLSVDGRHLTNGVQPLIVFLYVPFFWIAGADKWLAVRLTFILFAVLNVVSMYLMAAIVRCIAREDSPRRTVLRASVVAAGLWACLFHLIQHNSNGLETGLYACLILLSIWYAASRKLFERRDESLTKYAGYGAILGVCILARIDASLIVLAAMGVTCWSASQQKRRGVLSACVIGASAALVSSPWWLYNYFQFGSLMPISGQSESLAGLLKVNLATGPQILGDILSVFFYTPFNSYPWWVSIGWFILTALIVLLIARRTRALPKILALYQLEALGPLFLAGVLMFCYYVFFFSAPHFLTRYLHPLRILWLILISLAAPQLVIQLRTFLIEASRLKRSFVFGVLLLFGLAAALFNITRYTKSFTLTDFGPEYGTALWADRHRDGAVGMTASGITGFDAANVVNLDGKVNVDALRARQKHRLTEYIVASGMKYVADQPEFDSTIQAQALGLGAHFVVIDSVGTNQILMRTDSVATTERNNKLWGPI